MVVDTDLGAIPALAILLREPSIDQALDAIVVLAGRLEATAR